MGDKYLLNGGRRPVLCEDEASWPEKFIDENHLVALDIVGSIKISTIFTGEDQARAGEPPLLFETLVVGGPESGSISRCSTWDEAEAMHADAIARARQLLN